MTVGVIGDLHAPFEHKKYFDFVVDTFNEWHVDRVIQIGDVVDNHSIGFWDSDPDGLSSGDEIKLVRKHLKKWHEMFPGIEVTLGNHDDRIRRRLYGNGISSLVMKDLPEIFGVPSWKFINELVIDDVLYQHGLGGTGKTGAENLALKNRQSVVIGHSHAFGGCKYIANYKDTVFALNVGCGIDDKAYAFAYGRAFPLKSTLGCGIIKHGKEGYFIPMI